MAFWDFRTTAHNPEQKSIDLKLAGHRVHTRIRGRQPDRRHQPKLLQRRDDSRPRHLITTTIRRTISTLALTLATAWSATVGAISSEATPETTSCTDWVATTILHGEEGDDTIDGGADDDHIVGGAGNDSDQGGDRQRLHRGRRR